MRKVYGLMTNPGDGNELLWDFGVWETADEAQRYLQNELKHTTGIWVEEIKFHSPTPEFAEHYEEEMVECSFCGIEYNEADTTLIDNDEYICVNCEPEYKKTFDIA
ncbi:hypothetical protein CVD25_08070 [Bacillus canaveralius]|uniref:Uncharacterized protein n=1 Tax=Bacillus canaveralius TaxID=1403243 RepID=A0A2N5GIK0_9BACI|nr:MULTISPECIES: hypothetical protein [Bacillus]PLR80806.1 hypothetical protein CU635_17305 [Bacillus canaveralius]PLR81914.1 hypothetical protein CVD23_17570 [Bacillus sp. V33-4]PLR98317.1 hypothetical protein CVD25_08070 [Bacillus canaveralius]RSK52962.1 hypothetical protein EJA13_09895 [Bacillus canaveralius]